MAAGKLVATSSFAAAVKGEEIVVREGDEIPANHPVVKGREHLFEQITTAPTPPARARKES